MVMKKTQKRFLLAAIGSEGLSFFGTALSAGLGFAVPVGLMSAAQALRAAPKAVACARMGAALAVLFALCGALQAVVGTRQSVLLQRESIGTRKALGFAPGDILRHHLLQSLACALSALLLGLLLSVCLVQLPALSLLSPGAQPGFAAAAALLGALLLAALFPLAAYLPCARIVRRPAHALMRPEAPAAAACPFERSGAYARLRIRGRMALKSVTAPDALIPALLGTALCGAALTLSLALPHPLLAGAAFGLSLLMLLLVALSQAAAHWKRQAPVMSLMRACGYTQAETRSFALTGILALMALGLAAGVLLGLLLM